MNNQINRFSRNINSLNDSLFQKKMSFFFKKYKAQYFKKGAYVFLAGELSRNLYFIVNDGRIRLEIYTASGRNLTKAILGQGDVFGENALIGVEKHRYTARVRTDIKVRVIPIEEVKKIINEPSVFTTLLLKEIGQKLFNKEKQVESLVLKDARTRVIEFLLNLGQKGKRIGFEEKLVKNMMTHQEIADLTSTSRQTVTTTISELQRNNIITFIQGRMLVRNMDNLAAAIA